MGSFHQLSIKIIYLWNCTLYFIVPVISVCETNWSVHYCVECVTAGTMAKAQPEPSWKPNGGRTTHGRGAYWRPFQSHEIQYENDIQQLRGELRWLILWLTGHSRWEMGRGDMADIIRPLENSMWRWKKFTSANATILVSFIFMKCVLWCVNKAIKLI